MFGEGLSPEEYAARHAHQWMCFSLGEYRYLDPVIDSWISRLNDIFFRRNGAPTVQELRVRYLSPEERQRIEQEEREPF